MRRLLLIAAVALGAPAVADAQVWKPPKKARPAAKPAKKKQKKRPARKPAPAPSDDADAPPADDATVSPAGRDDDATVSPARRGDDDATAPDDARPDATSGDDAASDDAASDDGTSDDEASDDDDSSDDDDTSDDDSGDGATVRFDDEDDVGADVTFTESDLETDAADGSGGTRLETKALGYGRLAVDTVHDAPPDVGGGLSGTGEDVIGFRAHGRAEGTTRFREKYKVKVSGRADAELAIDADTNLGVERYEAQIWDTYFDAYLKNLDVRFGNQIIAWGTADLLSPNDVVNARDLRRGFVVDVDELRIPTLALAARAYTGPLSLQAVWIPVAPANRFELLEGDYAILGPHAATPVERRVGALISALASDPQLGPAVSPVLAIGEQPDNGIDTGEVGAHGSVETRLFDVHGYFLWGHERNPRIQLAEDLRQFLIMTPPEMVTPDVLAERITLLTQMGIAPVSVDYPRRLHAGVATATRIEPFGIKLDAAYSPKAATVLVAPGAGPVLGEVRSLPVATGVLSLDYDRGTDLSIVVEAAHTRVLDVPDGAQVFQMEKGDQLTVLGGRFSWNPGGGAVTLSALGFFDLDARSYAARPALDLQGNDHLSVELAATIYGGPDGSLGGISDRADEFMLTVQYGL